MKRFICMECELDFSKEQKYKSWTYKNGLQIEYTRYLCPCCSGEDYIDTLKIHKEIDKRIKPLRDENEYLKYMLANIQNVTTNMDLSKWA